MPYFDTLRTRFSKKEWRVFVGIPPGPGNPAGINSLILPWPDRSVLRRYRARILPQCSTIASVNDLCLSLASSLLSPLVPSGGKLYVGLAYDATDISAGMQFIS